ncbi:DnaD domain protein [Haloimpatiens sp. FM7315]|uniref:DnaD domain protein n=1 Tax=Haloimpatiens sp. FM7315 TaxID=3298609 RepID=UPI00370BB5E0
MSTFVFKNKVCEYTPVSNHFIENHMPKARGEFVKVYLLGLKYCISGELGVNSSMMAKTLNLLESDVMNALNYWNDEEVIKLTPIDNMGNFNIDFLELKDNSLENEKEEKVNLLEELNNNSIKDMLQDIEKLVGRPLSPKEMTMYLSWQKDFSFPPEIILLLIQYCASKGKTDYRYVEKIAIAWHDENIKNVEDAQTYIKKHEDKWIKIKKILNYLGIKSTEIMKPQEQMIEKWINVYKFNLEIIYKACDICFDRINKSDFKYIDGILNSWFKENISTLQDIEKKDKKKSTYKPKNYSNHNNKNSNFNDFNQREYDYEDLEKKLLGWDNE